MNKFSLILTALFALSAHAANYKYNELMIKDYDEMLEMVQDFTRKARLATTGEEENVNEAEAVEHLRGAMKLILSRPDSDNMVAKLMTEIRRDLVGFGAYETSISTLCEEAIDLVKNKKAATSAQSTSLFILENALAQIRPEAPNNPQLRAVVQRIKDANLKISDDIIKDRKLRGMFKTKNPSEIAANLMKDIEKADKAKAAQQKQEAEEEKKAGGKKKKVITDE